MTKILLVDDHAIVREGLRTVIERTILNAAVEEAIDGDSAFEKIKKANYDLIILDVNMPGRHLAL